jgi:N-acetyl-anhydromuramyl-L-alanine amidase AmpD
MTKRKEGTARILARALRATATTFETDNWPFVAARDFTKVTARRTVRLLVIHDMEFPETLTAAEDVARYFQKPDKPSSAHVCVDTNSVVQCVKDNNVAFAAPGANHDGIQIELAGYGKQSRADWLDEYSFPMLHLGADVTAQYCLKYSIPPIHLTNQALKLGQAGIIGHYQATQVYAQSDHTDPGAGFPWDVFLRLVQAARSTRLGCVTP